MFQSRTTHVPIVEVDWPSRSGAAAARGPVDDAFIAAAAAAPLPAAAEAAIAELRGGRSRRGAFVLRGVPVGTVGPTPHSPTAPTPKDSTSEASLLAVAGRLGEPVGYLPEHGGDVVQNIVPVRAQARRQTSTSSGVTLAFHTETAFHPHRPSFLVLLCVRGDPSAATTLCDVDDLIEVLPREVCDVLAEPRFGTRADESFGGGPGAPLGPPMAVLNRQLGPDGPRTLVYDEELTEGRDPAARAALDRLRTAVHEVRSSLVLEEGDLLAVDNRRCVHGRSPFRPRFDGTDRWLQRAFVVDDLASSASERVGRIITTSFAA